MGQKNTITQEEVNNIFSSSTLEVNTLWGKTTLVACKLPSGFVIVESSSCVDPVNFDMNVGYEICVDRIKNKIWELEGYSLQKTLFEKESD